MEKKSEVPKLNQAKLGLVKLSDSGKQWLTNVSFRTVSKLDKDNFKKCQHRDGQSIQQEQLKIWVRFTLCYSP